MAAMTIPQLAPVLKAAMAKNRPVFIWGAPGIGKTDLVHQMAANDNLPVIELHAMLMTPVDLKGVPVAQNGRAEWLPLGELPDEKRDGPRGILFIDEMNAATPQMMASLMKLVLPPHKLGTYQLPAGWRIIAAGNRQSDRASANRLPSALANRFLHFDLEASLDGWCEWASQNGIPAELIAFLRFKPTLLHSFEPDRNCNPTPRTWAFAADFIGTGLPADIEQKAVAAAVGDAPAGEFMAFARMARSLPNPDAVLRDPEGATVPAEDRPDVMLALMVALAHRVTHKTVDALGIYLLRCPPEFAYVAWKDAFARDASLQSSAGFTAWAAKHGEFLS